MKLACRICGAVVTRDISELAASDRPRCRDRRPFVPARRFYVMRDETYGPKDDIAVNLRDVVDLEHHPDARRNAGCCGRDAMDGKNLLCPQGHEVATEKSDCWMPHRILFSLADVKWID
jgi:hypothetical protein